MRFVNGLDETTDLGPHHMLERHTASGHHVHRDAAGSKRRRDLESDEASADHDGMFRAAREVDNGTAVGKRSEIVHLRGLVTGNGQPHRIGTGGNQEAAELAPGSVRESHGPPGRIDRGHGSSEQQLDPFLAVEILRPQRNPVVLRLTCQEVLRQVGAIDGRILIGADHCDRTVIAFATQHVRRCQASGPATENHDR